MTTKRKYTDVMVDIETTGVNPDENGMIQLAAVRFNLVTEDVDGDDMFNRALAIPPKRFWDEGTREWWGKRSDTYRSILVRMEPVERVLRDFTTWSAKDQDGEKLRFWSKPSHFDFMFIQSYYKQFPVASFPFDFREAQDMRSFLRGLYFPDELPESTVKLEGVAHDAIFDVLHQIQVLQDYVKKCVS
jgi:hypothetical protein